MQLIEPDDAAPEVRAVFDDIKASRQVDDVNNWRALRFDVPMTSRLEP